MLFRRILVPLDDSACDAEAQTAPSNTPPTADLAQREQQRAPDGKTDQQRQQTAQHLEHRSVLRAAQSFAERMGAEVTLLHADPKAGPFSFVSHIQRHLNDAEGLANAAHELVEQGYGVSAHTAIGDPVEAILHAASVSHADVILMASHHRRGLSAIRHPSVTERVMAQSPIPVLIWPTDTANGSSSHTTLLWSPTALVIVPLDGSQRAEQALPFAAECAREYAARVLLVRVTSPLRTLTPHAEALKMEQEALGQYLHEVRHYLKNARMRLERETGLHVESMSRIGAAADEIVALADAHPGSLVVMASHGRTFAARTLLGSVSTEVMRQIHTPLMVISSRTLAINPPQMRAAKARVP